MNDERSTAGFEGLSGLAMDVLKRRSESLALEAIATETEQDIELLTFMVGEEWYSVRIEQVKEIHSEYHITPLPSVPEHILGVINIRGTIVSVTDFRSVLELPEAERSEVPVIVVGDEESETALVVDEIGDIIGVSQGGVEPPLSVIDKRHIEYIEGSVSTEDRLVAVVNLGRLLAPVGVES